MFLKLVFVLFFLVTLVASKDNSFIYNGFQSSNLYLDGTANLTSNGLLRLTNDETQVIGHAFYQNPILFKKTCDGSVSSFSTTFVFAITSEFPNFINGQGIVFVVSPTKELPSSLPTQYLGLFNESNYENSNNHVFGVELDTMQNEEFNDNGDNHVGVMYYIKRKKFAEILEDWEHEYGPHRFKGEILEAKDANLGSDYVSDEVELVLKLGLLCSHSEPLARPSMRQVMQYLERDIPLPDLSLLSLSSFGLTFGYQEVVKDKTISHVSVSVPESLLSGGR
ncbi:hypothetical protein TSUD_163610 [Trifolium subterraneum]|uniref:Legume lectin domain-containing protein n=1 Tax=Trifolium subterraneum TaxID=3900 RepID=A0A2Z6N4J6_TRISU|nr:hypothetical protein TSUD_163610 [Trifolium subterraneum]